MHDLPLSRPQIWQDERYERKCIAPAEDHDALLCWLERQRVAFAQAYAPRTVQSLYFDSMSLDDFGDTLSGVGERKKVRLRWYGASSAVRSATLEVKCKHNMKGVKLSYPVELETPLAALDLETLVASVLRQLPRDAVAEVEHAAAAVALIRYERDYLVSADGRVRATLDRDIRCYDQLEAAHLNESLSVPIPDLSVLELKYPAALDAEVRAGLEPLPRRLSRFSKYSTGVQRLLGV